MRSRHRDPEETRDTPKDVSLRRIHALFIQAKRYPDARVVLHDALLEAHDLASPIGSLAEIKARTLAEGYAGTIQRMEWDAQTSRGKLYLYFSITPECGKTMTNHNVGFTFDVRTRRQFFPNAVLLYVTRAGRKEKCTPLELLQNKLPHGWSVHESQDDRAWPGRISYRFFENDPPPRRFVAILSYRQAKGFVRQVAQYVRTHPDTPFFPRSEMSEKSVSRHILRCVSSRPMR